MNIQSHRFAVLVINRITRKIESNNEVRNQLKILTADQETLDVAILGIIEDCFKNINAYRPDLTLEKGFGSPEELILEIKTEFGLVPEIIKDRPMAAINIRPSFGRAEIFMLGKAFEAKM
jgi:hypothetical protein